MSDIDRHYNSGDYSPMELRTLFQALPYPIFRRLLEVVPLIKLQICYADNSLARKYNVLVVDNFISTWLHMPLLRIPHPTAFLYYHGYPVVPMVVRNELELEAYQDGHFQRVLDKVYFPELKILTIKGKISFQMVKQFLRPTLKQVKIYFLLTSKKIPITSLIPPHTLCHEIDREELTAKDFIELLELVPNADTVHLMPRSNFKLEVPRIQKWVRKTKIRELVICSTEYKCEPNTVDVDKIPHDAVQKSAEKQHINAENTVGAKAPDALHLDCSTIQQKH